jgi:hypothetical protein
MHRPGDLAQLATGRDDLHTAEQRHQGRARFLYRQSLEGPLIAENVPRR